MRNPLNPLEIDCDPTPLKLLAQPRIGSLTWRVTEIGIGTATVQRTYEARCRNCPDLY